MLVAVARRILAIPVTHFYDDFKIVDVQDGCADFFFGELLKECGVIMHEDKHQRPAQSCRYLGRNEDVSAVHDQGILTASLDEDRRMALLQSVAAYLQGRTAKAMPAHQLRGKL